MPRKKRRGRLITIAVVVLAVLVFIIYRFYAFGPKPSPDPLCAMASRYKMTCVNLAAPAVYDHGALIRSSLESKNDAIVALPSDYVFSDRCALSPTAIAFSQYHESPEHNVVFGSHTFNIDRNLSIGANLTLPKVAGLSLKAGPKLSEIRSIVLEADSAPYSNIDTNAFLNALSSCTV